MLAAAGGPAWRVNDVECAKSNRTTSVLSGKPSPSQRGRVSGEEENTVFAPEARGRREVGWDVLSSYGDVIESNKSMLLRDRLGRILFPTGPTRLLSSPLPCSVPSLLFFLAHSSSAEAKTMLSDLAHD